MTDYSLRFGAHNEQYAIFGTLSQPQTSDIRDCDNRIGRFNSSMTKAAPTRSAAADIFSRLTALDLKQKDLADALGLEENKISKIKSGERQFRGTEHSDALKFLADAEAAKGIGQARSYGEIVEHVGAEFHDISRPKHNPVVHVTGDGEVVQIQKLDLSLSMGPGTLIDDYVESELVSFDLNFVRLFTRAPSDRLRLVTGIGDSMEPTLRWGDLILIDANDRMLSKQDGIYWINLYGAAGIKRLRAVGPRRILVKSDNPLHDDQEVDADDLRIEGRAIWATRGL